MPGSPQKRTKINPLALRNLPIGRVGAGSKNPKVVKAACIPKAGSPQQIKILHRAAALRISSSTPSRASTRPYSLAKLSSPDPAIRWLLRGDAVAAERPIDRRCTGRQDDGCPRKHNNERLPHP